MPTPGCRGLLLCSLLAPLFACSGSSPSAPESVASFDVVTPHGTVRVETTLACSTSNPAKIAGEIAQGYRRANREGSEADSISVEPLVIYVLDHRNPPVWFDPPQDRVEFGCGDEGAIEHEMGHRIAYFLGRTCFKDVWHNVDINCAPM